MNLFRVSKETISKVKNMINFKTKTFFGSFIFVINLILSSRGTPFTTTQTVYIIDALSYDISKPLTVRCQSKDDDLGNKTFNASEEFNFSFKENPFGVHFSFVISGGTLKIQNLMSTMTI